MRFLVTITSVILVTAACGDTDPYAASRDQASEDARRIAEAVPLPPGYQRGELEERRAQTPKENRGGGQSGGVDIYYQAPAGTTLTAALRDFDTLLIERGYTRAAVGSNWCDSTLVTMSWANTNSLITLDHRQAPQQRSSVEIPYGYEGVPTANSLSVKSPADLPSCP